MFAYRRDLADIALAGRVIAPHYARPMPRMCGSIPTFIRNAASEDGALSQLLPGERFDVLEYAGGWAWGFTQPDHLVGYVEAIELLEPAEPTHIVCEKSAPVCPDDRIGAPVLAALPMGSLLRGEEHGACLTTEAGCVPLSHLRAIGERDADPAAVAERVIGAPYLAGGRTAQGIDDCGLVQLALSLCGVPAPRIMDQQRTIGEPLPAAKAPNRGDVIVFEAGVALMIDDRMLIHASRDEGRVVVEPLDVVARRTPILDRRRLDV